jgi:hypothetical protein
MTRVLVASLVLVACDQGRATPPVSFDRFVPHVAAPPAPVIAAPKPPPAPPPDPDMPPSVEPKAYAAWFASLPKPQQKRIQKQCADHPLDFQAPCGGIGPLHIPLPPHDGLFRRRETDPKSLYASYEAWDKALTRAQRRYYDRNCDHHGREYWNGSDLCGEGSTPLVVAFDDQPVAYTRGGSFAFAPGTPMATDWPTATTPWIALDRDGDGAITSGAELFGDHTIVNGARAANGFAALAALDANGDGRIDAADPAFAALVLWADRDGDRRSSPDELTPLASVIDSISLADHVDARCDARGNCEGERAGIRWHDARGAHAGTVVDVYLPTR